jgi:moderate conductance mechanosensitive channel
MGKSVRNVSLCLLLLAILAGVTIPRPASASSSESPVKAPEAPTPAKEVTCEVGQTSIDSLFAETEHQSDLLLDRLGTLFSAAFRSAPQELPAAYHRLTEGKGLPRLLLLLIETAVLIGFGLVMVWLVRGITAGFHRKIMVTANLGMWYRVRAGLLAALLDILYFLTYAAATFFPFIAFFKHGQPNYVFISNYLIASYFVALAMFFCGIVLRPRLPALRLLPLSDYDTAFLYRWIVAATGFTYLFTRTTIILGLMGLSQPLFLAMFGLSGLVLTVILTVMILLSRERVAHGVRVKYFSDIEEIDALRKMLGEFWHVFAIFYVLVISAFWLAYLLLGNQTLGGRALISFLSVPLLIIADHWIQQLLDVAIKTSRLPETVASPEFGDEEQPPAESMEYSAPVPAPDPDGISRYAPQIKRAVRVLVVIAFAFAILRIWRIDLPIGRVFTRAVLSILVTILLAYVVWEFTKNTIDRKLRKELPDGDDEFEEGGAGGSRTGTLLILLRKFVLAVLFVMVTMIILAAIGVNIGPLIAGAGVLGLAVGFGAQTLVKDIISGIFFLLDDAFRVGDYVDTGKLKGTVEHISLRSFRLRHHRGYLHTIPFSAIDAITNFSRDYVVEKLEFRVRYGTDVDKVRKIIKKINNKIQEDEKMRASLLSDIKSQGVKQLDDSAMVMRVKFKSLPQGQFLIKRELLRLLQEAFQKEGIEFAHRNVTVYIPHEPTPESAEKGDASAALADDEAKRQAIGAAAIAAIAAAEEEEAAKQQVKSK